MRHDGSPAAIEQGAEATGRLQSIDVLRGVAILAVLFIHIPHDAPGGFRQNPWFFPSKMMDFGYLGVHLFVLISGFCIHRRAAIAKFETGAYCISWRKFWVRRFWRLYPPYLLAIVLSILAAMFFHDRAPHAANPRVADVVTHLLMVHNFFREFATSLGNGAFWSLGMEEQLYLLYALLLIMFRRVGYLTALLAVFALTFLWRALLPSLPEWTFAEGFTLGKFYLWPFMFWLHWTLGAVAAESYFGNQRLPKVVQSKCFMLTLLLGGIALNTRTLELLRSSHMGQLLESYFDIKLLYNVSFLGEIAIAFGIFFILCQTLPAKQGRQCRRLEGMLLNRFASLGRISYSVYLTHIPVLFILEEHLPFSSSISDWPIRLLVYLTVCSVVGVFYYHAVERWFLAGRSPLRLRRSAIKSSEVATIT